MVGVGEAPTSQNELEVEVRRAATVLLGLVSDVGTIEPRARVVLAQRAQQEFAAVEAAGLAEMKAAGASDRDVTRRAAAGGTRSRSESSKLSKRADAVGANPELATLLGDGSLGADHVDAIADAASKSGGDAARDEELIRDVADSKPDDAHKVAAKWLERREDDGAQSRYDRQKKRRKVTSGRSLSSGCFTIKLSGSDEAGAEMLERIRARAHEHYLADGGRDLADADHPRTHAQRMFDAAYELIMQDPAAGRLVSSAADAVDDADSATVQSAPARGNSHPRSMIHVTLTVDDDAEAAIRAECPNGQGYLPASVLERYECGAMLGGTVFNSRGEILWHGRQRRYATPAQFAAMVVRDGGCVLCGASSSRCEAHHLNPFNAPVAGRTNIDEMALLCSSCHHWLHDQRRTLTFTEPDADGGQRVTSGESSARGSPPKRTWQTRPATPEEIAPQRKRSPKPETSRQVNRTPADARRPL